MPEEFSSPFPSQNQKDNSASAGEKFAPPPSNVFIRTSETDIKGVQSAGGNVSSFPSSPAEPVPTPPTPPSPTSSSPESKFPSSQPPAPAPSSSPSFSVPENNPPASSPSPSNFPSVNPQVSFTPQQPPQQPPSIIPEGGTEEIPSFPQPETPKKNKFLPFIIIGVLILGGAALGYFVLWPKIFHQETPVEVTTTTTITTTTTTTRPPSPYTSIYIPISSPFTQTSVEIIPQGDFVVQAIKDKVLSSQAPAGTFEVLTPQVHRTPLTNEETILSLIPSLPQRLKTVIIGRPFLLYAYHGEVNPSLGLIVDIGTENVDFAKSVFLSWEKNLNILKDIRNFYLISIPKKRGKHFTEAENLGATIRVYDYSGKETDFAYAFWDKYLIMCSSEEGLNSALTHLQGNLEPIYP